MNILRLLSCVAFSGFIAGCADGAAEQKAREEAEAKARAEAARKEMQVLPETFKPRYNKKLDPSDSGPSATEKTGPEPAPKN